MPNQLVLFDGVTAQPRRRRGRPKKTGPRHRYSKTARCVCGQPKTPAAKRCAKCRGIGKREPRICPNCGVVFSPNPHVPRRCCSPACARQRIAQTNNRPNRLPDSQKQLRLRARRARAGAKRRAAGWRPRRNYWRNICARDGWICWLCNKPIDPSLLPPHRFSGSMDHVVPLSRGGSDDHDNLRAAHLTCNARRCDRPRRPAYTGIK
jgi:hypothetical protein